MPIVTKSLAGVFVDVISRPATDEATGGDDFGRSRGIPNSLKAAEWLRNMTKAVMIASILEIDMAQDVRREVSEVQVDDVDDKVQLLYFVYCITTYYSFRT